MVETISILFGLPVGFPSDHIQSIFLRLDSPSGPEPPHFWDYEIIPSYTHHTQ